MVIVTGTTGSGKSTMLAAMVDHINRQAAPPHRHDRGSDRVPAHSTTLDQSTSGRSAPTAGSFGSALRRVLRQDPDVILIGEMRDEETVATALSAAETGHLVFSTLHTADAAEAINRMIDFCPPHQQGQIRSMLASTLRGVISQRLVPQIGGGRVAALEVLRATGRVRDAILGTGAAGDLSEIISEGGYYGMQTFDQALFEFVRSERVSREAALALCSSPQDFKLLLAAEGQTRATLPQGPSENAE